MKQTFISLLSIIFFTAEVSAQKKTVTIDWKIAGTLSSTGEPALGVAGPVTGLHNEMLIVAGGANFPDGMPWTGGKKKYHDLIYTFRNTNDSLHFYRSCQLPFPLAYAATCSTPDGVLAAGGENENGLSKKSFLIQFSKEADSIQFIHLPDLPYAVSNASAVVHDRKVYLAGGEKANDVSDDLLVIDLANSSKGWSRLSVIPKKISHAVVVIRSNRIYIIGGRKRNLDSTSDLFNSVLSYDLKKNEWEEKKTSALCFICRYRYKFRFQEYSCIRG